MSDSGQIGEKEVLKENKVKTKTELLEKYIEILSGTEHNNQNYRPRKLKSKLERKYGDNNAFCYMEQVGQIAPTLI